MVFFFFTSMYAHVGALSEESLWYEVSQIFVPNVNNPSINPIFNMVMFQKGLGFWQGLVPASGGWPDWGKRRVGMGGRVDWKQNKSFKMIKIYMLKISMNSPNTASWVAHSFIFALFYLNWRYLDLRQAGKVWDCYEEW